MAKINIPFYNSNYSIEESALDSAKAKLKSHLQTTMAGTGATINLGGTSYNIDSTKLTTATNAFISHLGTVAGSGSKVVVNGVTYSIDSAKMNGAVADLHVTLGGLHSPDGDTSLTAGLYETGAIALYNEQGAEAIEGMMIKSWDELVSSGAMVINDGAVDVGIATPDNIPEKNEYGFYYEVKYTSSGGYYTLFFNKGGSVNIYESGVLTQTIPAGAVIYSSSTINATAVGFGIGIVSEDGRTLTFSDINTIFILGESPNLSGDLLLPNDEMITSIGTTFGGRDDLTGIVIPNSVISIEERAFSYCSNLTSVVIPEGVTSIGKEAFAACGSLVSIAIPNSVISIGDYMCSGCDNLVDIIIGNNVASIGDGAFQSCGFASITIPNSVTSIGYRMFHSCDNLVDIIIGNNVASIGEAAFYNCKNLISVTIPNSVTSIDTYAFYNCSGLTDVYYTGTEEQWAEITIGSSNTSITNATIHYNYQG